MDIQDRVIQVKDEDISWGFDDKGPFTYLKTPKSEWGTHVAFDPYPCYSHNRDVVLTSLREAEKKFPIGWPVFYFILPFEVSSRTNGTSTSNSIHDQSGKGKRSREGVIFFSGKRISIHPAMTRYLAAHEYGHQVDDWICNRRGFEHDGLDAEYAEMRGIENCKLYGARKHHLNIGEIIANDFRIAVCGVEREFWAHECEHPDNVPQVHDWWYKVMLEHTV